MRTVAWTIDRYQELISIAKNNYDFEYFGTASETPHVLWRHDIDYSLEFAVSLARLEQRNSVRATYFFLFSSSYYNLFSAAGRNALREVVACGHWIGLHFDVDALPDSCLDLVGMRRSIAHEASVLAELAKTRIGSVSLHNPGLLGPEHLDQDSLGGLVNAYGESIKKKYSYCSDSMGFWRFRPLDEVLQFDPPKYLHVLTHPVWWHDRPLGSRERISRVARARAKDILTEHDRLLEKAGLLDTLTQEDIKRGFHSPKAPRGLLNDSH